MEVQGFSNGCLIGACVLGGSYTQDTWSESFIQLGDNELNVTPLTIRQSNGRRLVASNSACHV